MSYSDFTILLARQRSGTNPLRARLASHEDIFCFEEVFSFFDKDAPEPHKRDTNFFTFLGAYAAGDVQRVFPDSHETLFLDFLDYLRCFSPKRHLVIDVKYNSMQFFVEPWSDDATVPYFLDLVVKYRLKVLNITRRNYLRYIASNAKAEASGCWHVYPGHSEGYADFRIRLDPQFVLERLDKCHAEDQLIARHFAGYPDFMSWEYAELFEPASGALSERFLATLAPFLGVKNTFRRESLYKRLSSLPLAETIDNFSEIERSLAGTPFEYCLEDEPAYAIGA
jgi:hypothetical protein